ncbi:MAG: hypothetical protein ACREFV_08095 [Acetobacteraceae bacterium]
MKIPRAAVTALALAAGMHAAVAQPAASGHSALALGAVVGSYSTILSRSDKAVLAGLLEGKALGASGAPITVTAGAVICRAGDVDITAFECALTFGPKQVELAGRDANELFATIGEAGVPSEGAAGTIYESLHAMSCLIDPVAVARNDGSGATCDFDPGPP